MSGLSAAQVREHLGLDPVDAEFGVDVVDAEPADGHDRLRLAITCPDGDEMPAYLLVPPGAQHAPGVVAFHQHASQWHLGKSEVCGLVGDPTNAFGPALARAGVVVLAPDAVAFEDRRRATSGTDAHPDDAAQHEREHAYRTLRGGTLAQKVLNDAQTALGALLARREVDAGRVGVLGHSFGGNTVIFHAALDARVRFAATSGAAATYRERIDREIGIERASIVPGAMDLFDIDDLTGLVAPRPLAIFAGEEDRYACDADVVAQRTGDAYRRAGVGNRLHVAISPGGHALTERRSAAIIRWVVDTASSPLDAIAHNAPPGSALGTDLGGGSQQSPPL